MIFLIEAAMNKEFLHQTLKMTEKTLRYIVFLNMTIISISCEATGVVS